MEDIRVVGNYAYLAGGRTGLQVIDVSNLAAPVLLGTGPIVSSNSPEGVDVVGNHAYVADGAIGLRILEIKLGYPQNITWQEPAGDSLKPNAPHPLKADASSGLPVTFRVESGPAVIASGSLQSTGLGAVWLTAEQSGDGVYLPTRLTRIFNARKALTTLVGTYDFNAEATELQVAGKYAYVIAGKYGLQILDVSQPSAPQRVAEFATVGRAHAVRVVGNLAYVTETAIQVGDQYRGGGLQILDVTNPRHPYRVGGYESHYGLSVDVAGRYAYVADGSEGMQILDVNDPSQPVRVGRVATGNWVLGTQVRGNDAYLASNGAGFLVVDIGNPAVPTLVSRYTETSRQARGLHVSRNIAYVADSASGLLAVDISDPRSPVLTGTLATAGPAMGVFVDGNYAYVAAANAGLQVIDVSVPAYLVPIGSFATGGSANAVQVVGNHAYVAARIAGLQIVELQQGFPQSVEVDLPATLSFRSTAVDLPAISKNLHPLTYSVVLGPATIRDGKLTMTDLGAVTLRVVQSGDANFLPASKDVTIQIMVPPLGVRGTGLQVDVHWPATPTRLQLQSRSSLAPQEAWEDLATSPSSTDGENHVLLDTDASSRFLRLIQP